MRSYDVWEFMYDLPERVWACVKRYRLLRLRGQYEFDGEYHALNGGKNRYFFDVKRPDGAGFVEHFDKYGELTHIDFFDNGETVACIRICYNPAQSWHWRRK